MGGNTAIFHNFYACLFSSLDAKGKALFHAHILDVDSRKMSVVGYMMEMEFTGWISLTKPIINGVLSYHRKCARDKSGVIHT